VSTLPPTRSNIESQWRGIIDGTVSRADAHEWAEQFVLAEDSEPTDPMVSAALLSLHGFDLTYMPPDRNIVRHGQPGTHLRSIAEITEEFWRWRHQCAEYDHDPSGYLKRVRNDARQYRGNKS
jgi:hypothetical protein